MMQHRQVDGVAINISAKAIDRCERAAERQKSDMDRFAHCRQAGESDPWFALRVMTGREQAVEKLLAEHGVEALVPMRKGKSWERRGRVIEGQMMPVIHGYVLVRFVADVRGFEAVAGVKSVIGLLRAGEAVKRISHSEVRRFYDLAKGGEYDWQKPCGFVVRPGDKVRMKAGPFEGMAAEVITPNGKGRGEVVISLNLFGQETPVTVPLAILEIM